MKLSNRRIVNVITLLLTFLTAQTAPAFYNPEIGRWANRDPIGELGGINLYVFVNENSINNYDPFGLDDTNVNKTEKCLNDVKKGATIIKQACKDELNKPIGTRGPLPGSGAAGAAGAIGGAVVEAGTGVLAAGPGVYDVVALTAACDKCKKCLGDCYDDDATGKKKQAECDAACAYCEAYKGKHGPK